MATMTWAQAVHVSSCP